eukprot:CAMPEP_0171225080 /NCGR_PEP_ID=MMETSP0790-20130122/36621_1 /TAXON_ID=2925 /ORGANISM="Alexandrium catenella, Strain OF101" /LENGTH=152 /DNA_ID=CAMNT_0011691099 /DNA_START=287 /DNA_END=742 /DNA_ORIENTATION=+
MPSWKLLSVLNVCASEKGTGPVIAHLKTSSAADALNNSDGTCQAGGAEAPRPLALLLLLPASSGTSRLGIGVGFSNAGSAEVASTTTLGGLASAEATARGASVPLLAPCTTSMPRCMKEVALTDSGTSELGAGGLALSVRPWPVESTSPPGL